MNVAVPQGRMACQVLMKVPVRQRYSGVGCERNRRFRGAMPRAASAVGIGVIRWSRVRKSLRAAAGRPYSPACIGCGNFF